MIHSDYLQSLVDAAVSTFAGDLVGVYLFGSAAYDAFEPEFSDLDVQAVVASRVPLAQRQALADRITHSQLPCPARKLEFVLHEAAAVAVARRKQPWLMNLNSGAHEVESLSFDSSTESSHWFLLDIAMGRRLGRALLGPAPANVFAPIPRLWQLEAVVESLAWHREHEALSANAVINAARGWRLAATGVHGSKRAAVLWVRQHRLWRKLVDAALLARSGTAGLDAVTAAAFLDHVDLQLQLTLSAEACSGEEMPILATRGVPA